MDMNTHIRAFYLNFFNNYLTAEKIAEHNGITTDQAQWLIETGKKLHEEYISLMRGDKA